MFLLFSFVKQLIVGEINAVLSSLEMQKELILIYAKVKGDTKENYCSATHLAILVLEQMISHTFDGMWYITNEMHKLPIRETRVGNLMAWCCHAATNT